MKKTLLITFTMIIVSILIFGCSSNSADKGENGDSTAVDSLVDSLAMKTFPIRNENNAFVTIETNYGNMIVELYRDVAPAHADSFLVRTNAGFYDGLLFFRIVDHFMIQGGDPNNNGTGNAGYYVNAEFSDLPHQDGTLSAARSRSINSASSQFFLCLDRNFQTKSLDGKYTVYGQMIKGYDVLHKIGSVECGPHPRNPAEVSVPNEQIAMNKVYQSDSEGNKL